MYIIGFVINTKGYNIPFLLKNSQGVVMYRPEKIKDISRHFQIDGEIRLAQASKIGHINETYTATYGKGENKVRYVHQKINQSVFKDPVGVMKNIVLITEHMRSKLRTLGVRDLHRRVLTVIPANDGGAFYCDKDGECWRTYKFIENAKTFEAVETMVQAYEAGKAYGNFQFLLSDLDSRHIGETIPNFHNTRTRFDRLIKALEKDEFNRAKTASKEVHFVQTRESIVDVLLNAKADGIIPERITHNDTKFNNVMLDDETGKELCVLDLDTVMPGLVLYDFGDMIRTTTSTSLEDEKDLSKVELQMPLFEALTSGYLCTAGRFLTEEEKSYLVFAGKLITFTIGIRFLTDYLEGDHYFRIHRPEHNLDRARTQFKLISSIEKNEDEMQRFVESKYQDIAEKLSKINQ